ncbi:hypothetical protein FD30_GL000100 [Levilactobacillus namurensis DSM 19117]|uniref:Uncharacterized protein n=1 Tax=Levilactobacillus namurensis DSM 19117 TaxID=1423773 RepID=A0A0R1K2M1_9LACO|nr:hypothetical protein [Levilactobacillus namurensis]KRK77352.1 hypothetical protein FD30_GL000100 [Levilactobacillus namurensis DSM 19117]GEO74371.1 hypothetical protein LNA02_10690 [Levilactobacillus namurensis]
MMKKVAMVAAAAAMVLPLGLGAIAPVNTGVTTAYAATKKAAKKTTLTLLSSKTLKKTAYHAKRQAALNNALFAADKATVTISKKGVLTPKTTVYATKKIVVKTRATKTTKAKTLTCVYVKSANGKVKGWIALDQLTKGKAVAAKKTTKKASAKKATAKKTNAKKTTKKATTKKAVTKKTAKKDTVAATAAAKVAKKTTKKTTKKANKTYQLVSAKKLKKTAYHYTTKRPAYFTGKFAADRSVVTLSKKGVLPAKKTVYATKAITVKQGKKTVKYLYVTTKKAKGFVLASALTAGKF